jgi:novobiocin biosynthesis protein NovU/D-mycarose 3-C-methyltransferase
MSHCGVCKGADFAPFFCSREWSCSGRYLDAPSVQSGSAQIELRLEYCKQCGLIRQQPGFEVHLDYTDIERDTAKQLPDYANRIVASLAEFDVTPDDLIVEVGANDGTFLSALRKAGYRNMIGVEPSKRLATNASNAGLVIRNDYFDRGVAADIVRLHGPARAVICRHTLEHVPDISGLTQGLAEVLAPGGLSFIEVPDTDWVVSELFAHEIWDEHITYFRAGSLARLVRKAGLAPIRLERIRFRDTRNLLCWSLRGEPTKASAEELLGDATGWGDLAQFQTRWDSFSRKLQARVTAAARPVIAIGASHIQLNFLNFTGLAGSVDLLVDDDPVKTGRYAPLASGVPIRATPDVLASVHAGTVLRTAFPYPAWEDRICVALARHGVASITPYELK